jgi:hypothetical protein
MQETSTNIKIFFEIANVVYKRMWWPPTAMVPGPPTAGGTPHLSWQNHFISAKQKLFSSSRKKLSVCQTGANPSTAY